MIDEVKGLAEKLRSAYGYSPTLNIAAAQCLEKLAAELEQVKRERNAAIADLKEADRLECEHCRSYGLCQVGDGEDIDCETCTIECKCRECRNGNQWEWRGLKEDTNAR